MVVITQRVLSREPVKISLLFSENESIAVHVSCVLMGCDQGYMLLRCEHVESFLISP